MLLAASKPTKPRYKPHVRSNGGLSRIAETYGDAVRREALRNLSSDEQARLLEERRWERSNPQECEALDALIGSIVVFARPKASLDERVTYPAGTRLLVQRRYGRWLLVETVVGGTLLLVKAEWIQRPRCAPTS